MEKVNVFESGELVELSLGQKVLVFDVGAGRTYFGELATFEKVTSQHLVFRTESGAVVKTKKDNIDEVVGKAKKAGYAVTTKVEGIENDKNFHKHHVIL